MDIELAAKFAASPAYGRAGPQAEVARNNAQPAADAPQQKVAEPVISPVLSIDNGTGAAVLKFKNDGEQEFQLPSRATLQYQTAQKLSSQHKEDDGSV